MIYILTFLTFKKYIIFLVPVDRSEVPLILIGLGVDSSQTIEVLVSNPHFKGLRVEKGRSEMS